MEVAVARTREVSPLATKTPEEWDQSVTCIATKDQIMVSTQEQDWHDSVDARCSFNAPRFCVCCRYVKGRSGFEV